MKKDAAPTPTGPQAPKRPIAQACQRCGFLVPPKLMGCKNPCPNCGTVYPHGDCSD